MSSLGFEVGAGYCALRAAGVIGRHKCHKVSLSLLPAPLLEGKRREGRGREKKRGEGN